MAKIELVYYDSAIVLMMYGLQNNNNNKNTTMPPIKTDIQFSSVQFCIIQFQAIFIVKLFHFPSQNLITAIFEYIHFFKKKNSACHFAVQ